MTQLRIDARRRKEAILLVQGYRTTVDFGEPDLVQDAADSLAALLVAMFKITKAELRDAT